MAQRPARRHVIAEIRLETGLSQAQLAEILDCAAVTVQRIEQGSLALSAELAAKAQKVLDVDSAWLLANDPTQSPLTPRGNLWTKDFYKLTQGTPPGHSWEVHHGIPRADAQKSVQAFTALKKIKTFAVIDALFEGSAGLPKQGILFYELDKKLKELREKFNADQATLEKYRPKIEKATKAFEGVRKRITDREMKRIWRDNPDLDSKK
jgi:transcriptional regulator with XRE-family HTH domain